MRPTWFLLSLLAHAAAVGAAVAFAVGVGSPPVRPRVEIQPSVAAVPAPPPAQPLPPVEEEQVEAETALLDVQVVEPIEPPPSPDEGVPRLARTLAPSLQRIVPAPQERAEPVAPMPAAAEPSANVEAVPCVDNEPPDYPERERRLGHQGVVVLTVRVSPAGAVTAVAVKTPSPHPALDREAVRVAWRWRFEPAQRHGRPVVCDTDVDVVFQLRTDAR